MRVPVTSEHYLDKKWDERTARASMWNLGSYALVMNGNVSAEQAVEYCKGAIERDNHLRAYIHNEEDGEKRFARRMENAERARYMEQFVRDVFSA